MATTGSITRLAPSPTGAMHLGNARTFLLNALLARQRGWRVIFRMEDLDGPRVQPGAAAQAVDELRWLGLEWQGEIVTQSQRQDIYQASLDQLSKASLVYPCTCSRREITLAASAPAREDRLGSAPVVYPGTCRDKQAMGEAVDSPGRPRAWRVRVRDETINFEDKFAGLQSFNLAAICGDFIVFRNEGLAAYQLAVVVDDALAGVDKIVRGDDLLESAAMQIHLRKLLGMSGEVEYFHLPLVVGPDGRKLAKRHGDTKLATYIRAGVSVNRILGLLGYWSGLLEKRDEADLSTLQERFDLEKLGSEPIVFSQQDDKFLRA